MADNPRVAKMQDRIREIVASTIDNRVKDPRLGFVTITDVRVTGDLQHASVFYTVLGDEQARRDSAAALNSAKGMIRSEMGRALGVRITPSLEFIPDAVPENAEHIEALLQEARERDAATDASRAGAKPAGEDDPYVKPRVVDEEN